MNIEKLIKAGIRYLRDANYRFHIKQTHGFYNHLPDEEYLKLLFRMIIGKDLNLDAPKTFNEKIQWLKLYDRRPEYTRMVDKCEAKKYVAERIGEEYIIPTLGIWDDPEDIDFDALPNQFVIKCNHNSGLGMCICRDKSKLDIAEVRRGLKKGLRQNYYLTGREWSYQGIKPKVIAEQFIAEKFDTELMDYKFMCFDGEVKCSFVCSNRFSDKGLHVTFFDRDWNVMPFERHHPSAKNGLPKPKRYEKMIELAEILSANIPFLRVDFYEVDGKIYFGELTFYPGSGFEEFTPEEWDYILGSWIQLPEKTIN